jgi:hypothetical protein
MNQEASCFNLRMTNLFIGLFGKNVLLRPYSRDIAALGYTLYGIEPSFQSSNGTVNPEGIVCSDKTGHCLLAEWTAASRLSSEKNLQILKYLGVNSRDLLTGTDISEKSLTGVSTWVVVTGASLSSFLPIIDSSDGNLLLSSFDWIDNKKFHLKFHKGDLKDSSLSSILSSPMVFDRIPEGYMSVPLDDFRSDRFRDGIIQEIISLSIQSMADKEVVSVSLEEIAKRIFTVWDYIDAEKQRGIIRAIKRGMREISRNTSSKDWLCWETPYWVIKIPSQSYINQFVRSVSAEKFTSKYEIFFDDDEDSDDEI